jgi:hypothetical protein
LSSDRNSTREVHNSSTRGSAIARCRVVDVRVCLAIAWSTSTGTLAALRHVVTVSHAERRRWNDRVIDDAIALVSPFGMRRKISTQSQQEKCHVEANVDRSRECSWRNHRQRWRLHSTVPTAAAQSVSESVSEPTSVPVPEAGAMSVPGTDDPARAVQSQQWGAQRCLTVGGYGTANDA